MKLNGLAFPSAEKVCLTVADHIVIPAAVIAMTSAVLSYLLDVRASIWTGNDVLKWIGFCFATATVLIARHGARTGENALRALYTLFLGLALMLAVLDRSNSWDEGVVGVLIVVFGWWFASTIVERLTWVDGPPTARLPALWEVMLYPPGELPRVSVISATPRPIQESTRPKCISSSPSRESLVGSCRSTDSLGGGHAGTATVRFAAVAIVVFAICEPILVEGPPEAMRSAASAVIVFFMAGSVVAAASSAVETMRAAKARAGEASIAILPTRIIWAAATMAIILGLGSLVPGVSIESTATRLPDLDPDTIVVDANPNPEGATSTRGAPNNGSTRAVSKNTRFGEDSEAEHRAVRPPGPWGDLVMRSSGPILGLIVAAMALYVAIQLRGFIGSWVNGLRERTMLLLSHLGHLSWLRLSATGAATTEQGTDLVLQLERLRSVEPNQAIVDAYVALRVHLRALGWPVRRNATPLELLGDLSAAPADLQGPLQALTDLYIKVAYAGRKVRSYQRDGALEALRSVRAVTRGASIASDRRAVEARANVV